ncbi:MAG: hypothetical protein H7X88_07500, partial [Gloeobacteraceae cyanobacterium ES-bin-316]|nr:hypothetical protein [Ferruginibacter sp.]
MSENKISVVKFEPTDATDFKEINLEWLNKYGLTEAPDLLVLNDPQGEIIDKGGVIFLARDGEKVVGTAALIRESP